MAVEYYKTSRIEVVLSDEGVTVVILMLRDE